MTLKRCSRGDACRHPDGPLLPATTDYFYRRAKSPDGLFNRCKDCEAAAKGYRRMPSAFLNVPEGHKRCRACENTFPATLDYFDPRPELKGGLASWCKVCRRAKDRRVKRNWYQNNRDESLRRSRIWRESNRRWIKRYRQARRMRSAAQMRAWRSQNTGRWREISTLATQRRKARKRALPDTFTTEEWITCQAWFGGCLICGSPDVTVDHWIPWSHPDCPGNVAANIIPLCKSCNSSKNAKLPHEWLMSAFGGEYAHDVLSRVDRYFDWIAHLPIRPLDHAYSQEQT